MKRQKIQEREAFTYDEKIHMYHKSNGRCAHCGKRIEFGGEATVEHFIPISKGGVNRDYNMIMLCESCNKTKSNKILAPENYLKYLNKKDFDVLKGYFESYIHSFEFMNMKNFFACDEYLISCIPEKAFDFRRKSRNQSDRFKIDYSFNRGSIDDIPRFQEFYINYLKKYDMLKSEEAANDNIRFWQRYGAIYYLEKNNEIKMMVPITIADLDGYGAYGLNICIFSMYSNMNARQLAMRVALDLPTFILEEQNIKIIKARLSMLRIDPLAIMCSKIGHIVDNPIDNAMISGYYSVGEDLADKEKMKELTNKSDEFFKPFIPPKNALKSMYENKAYEDLQWMIDLVYPFMWLNTSDNIEAIQMLAGLNLNNED